MDSKEAVASNSEGNREAKKVTDCAKPSESNARADSINARAIVNDPQRFSNRKRKQNTRLIRHMWSAIMMQGEKKMLQMANLKIQRRNGRKGKRKKKILKL